MSNIGLDDSADLGSILKALIDQRGVALLDDRRRILGLLRDRAPAALRATRILMVAYDQGVPSRFLGTDPGEIEIGREAGVLSAESGIDPELAKAAILTWARALSDDPLPVAALQPVSAEPPTAAQASSRPDLPGPASVQPLPPVEPAPLPPSGPPVQPLPPVSPLPPPAAATTAPAPAPPPAAVPSVTPLPPVSPLPSAASAPAAAQTAAAVAPNVVAPTAPAAPTPTAASRNWLAFVIVGLVGLAIVTKGIMWLEGQKNAEPTSSAPAEPAPSSTPQPTAPAPATSDAPPAITSSKPFNTYSITHIQNLPNTLAVSFGMNVNGETPIYTVAARFEGTAMSGTGLINVNRGDQIIATTGVVTSARFWGKNNVLVVAISGNYATNPSNMPPICAYVSVASNLNEVRIDDNSALVVMAQKAGGQCDSDQLIGFGNLQ